jgi:hypothetical protein
MTDSFPFFFGFVIVAGFFFLAVSRGVVSLLSSGVSFALALGVLVVFVQLLPGLVSKFAGIDLQWKALLGVSAGAALVVFVFTRIIAGFFFKAILGPEGFLHAMSDGVAGGILSLIPSLVMVVFLFTCIRISGTVHELNYAASLSRDGVEELADQIPPYPWTGKWRDGVESIPFMAPALDLIDPFSNRANRNSAAFSIMNQPDSAKIASNEKIIAMNREESLLKALQSHDRVALVMNPEVKEIASDPVLNPLLKSLELRPVLVSYVKQLKAALKPPPETL